MSLQRKNGSIDEGETVSKKRRENLLMELIRRIRIGELMVVFIALLFSISNIYDLNLNNSTIFYGDEIVSKLPLYQYEISDSIRLLNKFAYVPRIR